MNEKPKLIPSASVILLRDDHQGPSVLLLKKNANITFGGSWVFPGGRVDNSDAQPSNSYEYSIERTTVQRECKEETGLDIELSELMPLSRWVTPVIRPKRFTTLFFLYDANQLSTEVTIDDGEIVDAKWLPIAMALALHQDKKIVLAGPAFVTLSQFANYQQTSNIFDWVRGKPLTNYIPRIQLTEKGAISLYRGDSAYDLLSDEMTSNDTLMLQAIEQAEIQQRLYMYKDEAWVYVSSIEVDQDQP